MHMGNITNLATTGNYATEANGLKVSFYFTINNETKELTVSGGRVTEKKSGEDEMGNTIVRDNTIATFHKNDHEPELRNGITMRLTTGRELELAEVIMNAVKALEQKINQGEAAEAVVA